MKYENIGRCQFSTKGTKEMHFHQDIEIIYVLDGRMKITYNDKSNIMQTDDFILINSNVRHEYDSEGEILLGSIFIDYTMLAEIFNGEQLFFWCNSMEEKSESYEKMRYYIRQIFNYYQAAEGQGILLKNSLFYQLLYLITTDFIVKKGMQQYDHLRGIQDERLNEILSYIMTNYKEQITLKKLADRLFLSHTYLSKYIKQNFGMSFLKLVNNIRLEHAVGDLLYTDKTILKIALDNGFPNQAGFNHAFRESYHMTPAEYRDEKQEKYEKSPVAENSSQIMEKVEKYLTSNLVERPNDPESTVSIMEIDCNVKEKMAPNWNRMINVGQAKDLLRYDIRDQVVFVKENLNFSYIRFWNIFTEDMLLDLTKQNTKPNFKLLDQVIDFILQIGAKPHMELSIKYVHVFKSIERRILGLEVENQLELIEKNKAVFEEMIRHLVKRYGIREVNSWYFEMEWNSVIERKISIQTYFQIFDTVAGIIRNYAPEAKIGGAGFSLNEVGKAFPGIVEAWMKRKQKPSFLSVYSFPYIMNEDLLDVGRNPYSPDPSYLLHMIQEVKATLKEKGADIPELIVSEWSSTLSTRNCLNDGNYKSAYIVKNLIEVYGEVDSIGYWTATDIFSEDMESSNLLFGGTGLVSRDGIRKPAFFAYNHMNHSETCFYGKNKNAFVSGDGLGLYYIACHNYKHFNFRYYAMKESDFDIENQKRMFEDNESLQMSFKFNNVNNGKYIVKIYSVGEEDGNVQSIWKKLGYFSELSTIEIEYLKQVCQPKMTIHMAEAKDHCLIVESRLAPQETQGIVISEI